MTIPKIAPLKSSFLLASLLGLIISIMYIYDFSRSWAVAFAILFAMMIIASMISIASAPVMEVAPKSRKKRM